MGERCFLSALDTSGFYADHWFAAADKSAFSGFQHFDLVSTDVAEIDFIRFMEKSQVEGIERCYMTR